MASIKFQVGGAPGLDLAAIVVQVTSAGALSNRWDDVNQVWSANPTDANAKITLTEQTGARAGYYHGARASLGSYTGEIVVLIVNNAVGYAVSFSPGYLSAGVELVVGDLLNTIPTLATTTLVNSVKAKTDLIPAGPALETSVQTALGNTSTLVTRLTNTRANLMDNLTFVDVATSSRAAPGASMVLSDAERGAIVTKMDAASTKLGAVHAKLPSTAYLTGTTSSAGAIDLDAAIGSKAAFKADVSALATSTALATAQGNITTILGQTTTLAADWANGGRLDVILDTAAAGAGGGGSAPTTAQIVTAIDGTSVKLGALYAKMPSAAFFTGTSSSAGAIDLDAAIGSKAAFKADVSALATAAAVTTVNNNVLLVTAKLPSTAYLTGTTSSAGAVNLDAAIGDRAPFKADVSGVATSAALATAQGNITTIVGQTTALAADWANGGRLDLIIDAVNANAASVKADIDNGGRTDLLIDDIVSKVTSVKADIDNGGRTDLLIDDIQSKVALIRSDTQDAGRLDTIWDTTAANVLTLKTDWADGGRLDTALDVAAAGGAAQVFATEVIPRERRWTIRGGADSQVARNIITVAAGSTVYLEMDFSQLLAAETGIATAVSAVDSLAPAFITITDVKRSQDANAVALKIAGLTAGKKHQLRVVATTTDGQTLAGIGNLEIV